MHLSGRVVTEGGQDVAIAADQYYHTRRGNGSRLRVEA
jgi:hypothetical protein